tara:strand:- start:224 stop:394 length:171 start_codon:yes stop_codon:yes gene_type:complete
MPSINLKRALKYSINNLIKNLKKSEKKTWRVVYTLSGFLFLIAICNSMPCRPELVF